MSTKFEIKKEKKTTFFLIKVLGTETDQRRIHFRIFIRVAHVPHLHCGLGFVVNDGNKNTLRGRNRSGTDQKETESQA